MDMRKWEALASDNEGKGTNQIRCEDAVFMLS